MKEEFQFQFITTTNNLKSEIEFRLLPECKVRKFTQLEAQRLAESIRKKNVVARLGGANNYYVNQAIELGEQTIFEVSIVAGKDDVIELGMALTSIIEKLAILSTTFTIKRNSLHRKLGISSISKSEICFAFTHGYQTLRSKSNRVLEIDGIPVDKTFSNRFDKCGFVELLRFIQIKKDFNKRVMSSVNWLYESRREFRVNASVVKSAIALESLLIFSESESLARTLAERTAFLLSNKVEIRQKISKIISRFYDVRSGIVHGSEKKAKKLSANLIECVDRLILLIHLTIAKNHNLWTNVESLRLWYEEQRWGKPYENIVIPFAQSYLSNALTLVEEEMNNSN